MRAVLRDYGGNPVRLADVCKRCSAEAIRAADAPEPKLVLHWRHRTNEASGHGEPLPASVVEAHVADANRRFPEIFHWAEPAAPACEDCNDTGTITDPAPDAPGARPPEPCVLCPPAIPQPGEHPSDYCGPCKSGKHAKCYEPCLCRDRSHGAPPAPVPGPARERVTALIDALNKGADGAVVHGALQAAMIAEANASDAAREPPRTLPVTPAERFLATCLRAHQAWNVDGAPQCPLDPTVLDIARTLAKHGALALTGIVTPAGRDLLARVEAEERTPANVLRAMLASYSAAVIELRAELWRGPTWPPLFARQLDVLDHAITTLHNALGAYLAGSPRAEESLMSLGRLIRGDYTARLAGTTPIDAPPAKEPR
jgi:hypothetical protein